MFRRINKDSLIFNKSDNSYFDKFGDKSGSFYRFDKENRLSFYCFLNDRGYPYAEYYNSDGSLHKIEGRSSLQVIYFKQPDSSYLFSFLYSTFRKSGYRIRTETNFNDTLYNELAPAERFSNAGYFDLAVRTHDDVLKMKIVNHVSYFDSARNNLWSYSDTLVLKEFLVL